MRLWTPSRAIGHGRPMSGADPKTTPVDEFDLIARLLRPLTDGAPEALELLDDAAVLTPKAGEDLIVTADMIGEGVHFLTSDPMDLVARKLLRVNLSDLAAKGATPYAYFLTIAWPSGCGWSEREAFVAGLRRDQDQFGLKLLGGDTVSTAGPFTLSATMLGRVPAGQAVLRSGAKPGDLVLVSGQIGDGWLGLQSALGLFENMDDADRASVLARYRTPEPRLGLTDILRRRVHAAADVSDGLVADSGHIARASGVAITLDLGCVPMSRAGADYVAASSDRAEALIGLATGGDDYEIVLTLAPNDLEATIDEAARVDVPLAVIGRVVEGQGVRVSFEGREIRVSASGYRHG